MRAGATITFRNDDDREHTASATLGAFETGVLTPGASGRVKLASPGSYRYVCLIHPDMTGTITVAAASGRAAPAAPTSAPTTAPTAAPTTVPATPPATAPTPDPTPETTPGPTILEAGIGAAGPPDGPATTADAMATTGLDTASAGRLLLVVLVTGAAIVTFARLVAGTGRRRDAPTVSRDPG